MICALVPCGDGDAPGNLHITTWDAGNEPAGFPSGNLETFRMRAKDLGVDVFAALNPDNPRPNENIGDTIWRRWSTGFERMEEEIERAVATGDFDLRLEVMRQTAFLPVEYLPIRIDGRSVRLEEIGPIYRTLMPASCVGRAARARKGLAVVYESARCEQDTHQVAQALLDGLSPCSPDVKAWPGRHLIGDEARETTLRTILHEYRVLVFVGGSRHAILGSAEGFILDAGNGAILTPKIVADFFQSSAAKGLPVPELVIMHGCGTAGIAGGVAGGGQKGDLSFPEAFLSAGVPAFIGAAWEVFLKPDLTSRFLIDFLKRWWPATPGDVPRLFFTTKKEHGFALQTAAYQIYLDVRDAPGTDAQAASALAPIAGIGLAALRAGDQLRGGGGEYRLGREIAADAFSRLLAAETNGQACFLELLSEACGEPATVMAAIESRLTDLQKRGLPAQFLLPTRLVKLERTDAEGAPHSLLALHYAHAAAASPHWHCPARSVAAEKASDTQRAFFDVLRLGAEAARLLATLHAAGATHGSFSPAALVMRDTPDLDLLIRGLWVQGLPARQTAPARFAPPDATGGRACEPAEDCWALGLTLYELAVGAPPDEAALAATGHVALPARISEANKPLAACVVDCLHPEGSLRPSLRDVAERLTLATAWGGAVFDDFAREFYYAVKGGRRLVLVRGSFETGDIARALAPLEGKTNADECFRIIEAAEKMSDIPSLSGPGLAQKLGELESESRRVNPKTRAIIVIEDAAHWMRDLGLARAVRLFAREDGGAIVVLADRALPFIESWVDAHMLTFNASTPSALYERLLAFTASIAPDGEPVSVPPLLAARIAPRFAGASWPQIALGLRMAALAHRRIDEHALSALEMQASESISQHPGLSYWPLEELPPVEHCALPDAVRAEIDALVDAIRDTAAGSRMPAPSRLLIEGPEGSGKTFLARALAREVGRPVVQVNPAACASSSRGAAESDLGAALRLAESIGPVVVIIERADRFFGAEFELAAMIDAPAAAGQAAAQFRRLAEPWLATLARMGAVVEHWLDIVPAHVMTIVTASRTEHLPAAWRRRLQMHWRLPALCDADDALKARTASALFRAHGLEQTAEDRPLMARLCRSVGPGMAVPAPISRRAAASALRFQRAPLETAGDLDQWIAENLRHRGAADPEESDFWLASLQPLSSTGAPTNPTSS